MRKSLFRMSTYSLALLLTGLLVIPSCKKKDSVPKSNLAGFTSFSIKDMAAPFTIDESKKMIQNADSLPFQSDVSKLVAVFNEVPNSIVNVGGVLQVSGTTVNDFTHAVQYVVTAQDGVTKNTYTVQVNVAKTDPKTISWQQLTPDAGWGNFHSIMAASLGSKYYMLGGTMGAFGAFSFASYTSPDATTWTRTRAVDQNGDSIPRVESGALISFKNQLWLLGGHRPGVGFAFDDVTNKVWSSSDGLTWVASVPANAADRWSARERIGAVVFNSKLWVIGGNPYPAFGNTNTPSAAFNDVWSSSDGTTWTVATTGAAFIPRTEPAVFVYDNKIWLVGGKDNSGNYLNDVWNSTDGINWTEVTTNTQFTGRFGHEVVVNNDELILVGGENASGVLNDMWISENKGVDWTLMPSSDVRSLPSNFKGRKDFSMFVNGGAIYIMGGLGVKDANMNYTHTNDVWKGLFH
ncbi:MAG: DUF6242 domain-containing protein [Ginsengibacter sp.]